MALAAAGGAPPAYFQDPLQIAGIAMSGLALALVLLGLVRARRARLSKAFLLDSQGTPLKELVLDPRCTLTLAEATGNLPDGGPEAEARVSGYRVLSVPANNLRLILASRGRITPDHVHYAKFLMVSVQDRSEDVPMVPHAAAAPAGTIADAQVEGPDPAELQRLEEHLRSEASSLERERVRIQSWSKDLEGREEVLERAASEAEARTVALVTREAAVAAEDAKRRAEGRPPMEPAAESEPAPAETSVRIETNLAELEDERRILAEGQQSLRKRLIEVEYREEKVRTLDRELRGQVQDLRATVKALTADRDRLAADLETRQTAPKAPPSPAVQASTKGGVDWEQVEKDRKFLQKWALDLIAHEEAVRDRETALEKEAAKLSASRKKLEAERSHAKTAKEEEASFDIEAARKDIEKRIKILQEKALDLLQREEKLRKRNEELQAKEKKTSARAGPH